MRSNESTRTELVGNVSGCDVIVVDDMIDSETIFAGPLFSQQMDH